ncbi:MAG: TRAP transporter small permease [Desulfobacteraceae bacterium]|jgi:TRAP-type C4-dicarboxylate transport system permease small subunit
MEFQLISGGMGKIIRPVKKIFLALSAVCLALMMFLTALDVGLRYIFNSPIPGALELVEYMMALIVPFALTITAFEKAHIGVELVMDRFPKRLRACVACVTNLMVFTLYGLITWQSFLYIFEQRDSGMTSAVLLIPQYPFVVSLTAAFALLSLITLMHFLENLTEVFSQWIHS